MKVGQSSQMISSSCYSVAFYNSGSWDCCAGADERIPRQRTRHGGKKQASNYNVVKI